MIRQTTSLPLVEPAVAGPAATTGRGRLGMMAFVVLEVLLLAAVPVLAIVGFRSLLTTRSGEFVVEPTPSDPGWQAFVDPTPLSAVVEVVDGEVSGLTLVIPNGPTADGGAVVLVPGSLRYGTLAFNEMLPSEAVQTLEALLRLRIERTVIADEAGWEELLGGATVEIANPDPVADADGGLLVPVGRATLDASTIPAFLGRPLPGALPMALEFRRDIFWRAVMDQPELFGAGEVASSGPDSDTASTRSWLAQVAVGVHEVESLPVTVVDGSVMADIDATDALTSRLVALPAGTAAGDRLQVRILDRSGANDLEAAARALGAAGFEVVQIGNVAVWDELPSQILTTAEADPATVAALAALVGAATVESAGDDQAVATVTVLLADDSLISSIVRE